jgi:hypothetical protein
MTSGMGLDMCILPTTEVCIIVFEIRSGRSFNGGAKVGVRITTTPSPCTVTRTTVMTRSWVPGMAGVVVGMVFSGRIARGTTFVCVPSRYAARVQVRVTIVGVGRAPLLVAAFRACIVIVFTGRDGDGARGAGGGGSAVGCCCWRRARFGCFSFDFLRCKSGEAFLVPVEGYLVSFSWEGIGGDFFRERFAGFGVAKVEGFNGVLEVGYVLGWF